MPSENTEWSITNKTWIKFWPKGTKSKDYPVKTYYKLKDIDELILKSKISIKAKDILYEEIIKNIKPYKTTIIKEYYE